MPRNFKHENMKGLAAFITPLFVTVSVSAQTKVEADSIDTYVSDSCPYESVIVARKPGTSVGCHEIKNPYRFRPTRLIIPAIMIGVGFIGLESDWLKYQNNETKDELQEHPHSKLGIDDFSQYAPLAAAYGLRLCGIKGLHDYVDLTIISGTAYLFTGLSVYGVKTLTRVERPNGSTHNSFPSGHTATAFAGAEILRREYWDVSPWIGVAGYAVAAGTGFLRMYNNRHWLTDVVEGAGFGILCAQAAYWLYPVITKTFFHKRHNADIFLSPYVSQDSKGLALQLSF